MAASSTLKKTSKNGAKMYTNVIPELDMYKFFSLQLPLTQIFDIARRNHHARLMEKEIALLTTSDEELVEGLMDDIVKSMKKDISLADGKDIVERITSNLSYLRKRFGHITAYFTSLPAHERKGVVLDFLKQESRSLNRYKDLFENLVETRIKTKRTLNEMLILSYYQLYYDKTVELYKELEKTKPSNLNRIMNRIFFTVVLNKPIFLAYFKNNLDYDTLLDKFADLRVDTRPQKLPVLKPKDYGFYQNLAKIPLMAGS